MGAYDDEGRCPISRDSQRNCILLAVAQVLCAASAMGLSTLPYFDDNSLCSQNHRLCLADLHRHSWWLTPPTSFWAAIAALCMLKGQRTDKTWSKSWWLSTSFDLQVMVAPVSAVCFVLLGWQALWLRHVHINSCSRGAASVVDSLGQVVGDAYGGAYGEGTLESSVGRHHNEGGCGVYPSRAMSVYAGLSFLMQLQAVCAVAAAMAVRGGRLESSVSRSKGGSNHRGNNGHGKSSNSSGRKGGWRKRINTQGNIFYEHRRTGRVEYELPTSDVEEGRSDLSGCEGRLARVEET